MVDMDHSDSDEFAALDMATNLFAFFAILYLLVRHVLLVRGDLHKDDFLCGDCSKACVNSLKGPCTDEPKPTPQQPDAGSHATFYDNVIFYCTFGCMLSYMCYAINAAMHDMTLYEWLPFGYCRVIIPIGGVSLISAKSNLYGVLVARLHLAFHGSGVGYSTKVTHAMLASVFVYWLFLCLLAATLSYGERLDKKNVSHKICRVMAPDIEIGTMTVFDFCFSVAVAIMFISALRTLLAARKKPLDQRQKSKSQKEEAVLYGLIQKYAVLTTVAVLSTLLTLGLFILFVAGYLIALNAVVDCVSILFMTGKWQPFYDELCGPLLRCAVNTPCLPCVDVSLMEAEIERGPVEETVTMVSSKPRITSSLLVLAPTRTVPGTVPVLI